MSKFASLLLFIACCCIATNSTSLQAKTDYAYTTNKSAPNNKQFDFNISPNPAKDNINIEFSENVSGIICIHDNLGNQVLELEINNKSTKDISLEDLNNGIYFISVKTNSETVIKRLIKF